MPIYTKTGSFVNGSAPGISASFLNAVETQLVAVPYGINPLTPYQLANNSIITSGSTNTYTCTGGATGVPSGAVMAYLNCFFTPGSAGTYATLCKHGVAWGNGSQPMVGTSANATNIVGGSVWVQLDGSGQIDVKANTGACNGFYLWIYAYAY